MIITSQIIAAVTPTAARSLRRWIVHLGGLGLIPLGLLDNSIIPLPGSMDVVLIILCARQQDPWLYYALMATVGALIGGYVTYRLARRGGRQTLERRFPRPQVDKINRIFERWGFGAVAIPALLPPPFPFVPFLLAAGALQYSRKKFLIALTLGRAIRYFIVAVLGFVYGRHILRFFSRYNKEAIATLVGLAVVGTALTLIQYLRYRKKEAGMASRSSAT